MLIQEVRTELSPPEVLRLARDFFLTRFTPYGAFVAEESEDHLIFHVDAGELVLGVEADGEGTRVRGSTSRLQHELSQFLVTLASPEAVRQNVEGPGTTGAG